MQRDARYRERGDQSLELLADGVRPDGFAVFAGEKEAGVGPLQSEPQPLGVLPCTVRAKDSDGVFVEADDARAGTTLRRTEHKLRLDLGELLGDTQQPRVEVDVVPAQAARLATTQAQVGNDVIQRSEPVAVKRVQEDGQLLRVPDPHRRTPAGLELDVAGDVVRDEATSNGLGERSSEGRMHAHDGGGGERAGGGLTGFVPSRDESALQVLGGSVGFA